MSDAATASSAAAQSVGALGDAKVKSPKKKTSVSKTKKANVDHPKYSQMVQEALGSLKERGGSSRQAVLKYIMKNFKVGSDENVVNTHLKMALRAGVKNSSLKQSKGSGASGSFRLGEEAKKKPASKAKKPKSPSKASSVAKKPVKAKTAAGSKSPKKMAKKAAAPVKKSKAATAKPAAAAKKTKADKPKKAASATPKKVKTQAAAKKTPVKKAKPAATKKAAPSAKPKKVAAAKKPAVGKKA
jgi:histone H1/5